MHGQLINAPCVAPSRVTQKDFCFFSGVISSHRPSMNFKLVSFFTYVHLEASISETAGDRICDNGAPIGNNYLKIK